MATNQKRSKINLNGKVFEKSGNGNIIKKNSNRLVFDDIQNAIEEKTERTRKSTGPRDIEKLNLNKNNFKENVGRIHQANLPFSVKTDALKSTCTNKLPEKQHESTVKKSILEKKVLSFKKNVVETKTTKSCTSESNIHDRNEIINRNFSISSPLTVKKLPVKEKKNLPRRKDEKLDSEDNSLVYFADDILFEEYIHDNIKYLLTFNKVYQVPLDYLEKYENSKSRRFNALIWLLRNKDKFFLTSSMYLTVVRFFDNTLQRIYVPERIYKLIIATLSWIITKSESPRILTLRSVVILLNHSFEKYEVLKMEQKLLRLFNYQFNVESELTFAFYNLHELNIKEHCDFFNSAIIFLLETFSLSKNFSTFTSSELGGAAVHLSLHLVGPVGTPEQLYNWLRKCVKCQGFPSSNLSLTKIETAMIKKIKDYQEFLICTDIYEKQVFKTLESKDFSLFHILNGVYAP